MRVRPFVSATILVLTTAATACAGAATVTFFPEEAMVEVEATAVKGRAEIFLPAGMQENTLRIRPLAGAVIQRVDTQLSPREKPGEQLLETLAEQKSRLEDRLKALATREKIFMSAAKSQSGKAPRKSKTNPDPMQSIRQGTDFAIAQLEAVYTSKRKTEQEIRRIESRMEATRKNGRVVINIARVTVTPQNGRVKARFAIGGPGWTPCYDIRLDDAGSARVTLFGQAPVSFEGYLLRVSPTPLDNLDPARQSIPVTTGQRARLADYRLPVAEEQFGTAIKTSFGFTLKNSSNAYLPSGVASLYRNGEYWGNFRFEGISSGRSRRISSAVP
jgi:N-terminal domain of unknown function (DUF4140)